MTGVLVLTLQSPLRAVGAKQGNELRRIGVLDQDGLYANNGDRVEEWQAFVAELARLGHVEGRNVAFVQRRAEFGRLDSLDTLAAELVRLKVDVIFAIGGTAGALAAKRATTTIPIIFNSSGDPVGLGLVASLARPGGNLTGNAILNLNLAPKSLQLLAEAAGKLSSVADLQPLGTRKQPWFAGNEAAMRAAAAALGVRFQFVDIESIADFDPLVRTLVSQGVDGVIVGNYAPFVPHLKAMAAALIKLRLPSIGDPRHGFLLDYNVNWLSLARSSASYVDRVLKGARPAELPVEQPIQFQLAINLGTAKALGLGLPKALLLRADRVIQ